MYSKYSPTRISPKIIILKLEDMYGSFDVMLFSRQYSINKEKAVADNIVKIKGRLSISEKGVTVIASEIANIDKPLSASSEEKKEEKKSIPKLYLMYDLTDKNLSDEIFSLLKCYPGESPVIVKCSKQNKPFMLSVTVNPKGFLINELHAYIEDDYIKVI